MDLLKLQSNNVNEFSFNEMLVSHELGGAGIVALDLVQELRKRNKKSVAWIPGEGAATAKARQLGVPWYQFSSRYALSPWKIAGALGNLAIARALRRQRPGLIHVHSPLYYGALSVGMNLSQLKTVVHVQIEEEIEGLRWAFRKPPDVIITCAQFLETRVRSALPTECHEKQWIRAVPNSVDTERFYPADKSAVKARFGLRQDAALVLMVANLAPHKGQETALRAAAILRDKGVAAEFWFAGSERGGGTEYTDRLRVLAHELGIADRIRLLGQRSDIPELLQATDVFLLPSTSEGLPLSILEAQASKVAVLAAPTAGIPEIIINGKTGFLVEADCFEGYAHYLMQLLRSPRLYSDLTDSAYLNVRKEYSWSMYVERICEIYQTLNNH